MPAAVVHRLHTAIVAAVELPEIRERLASQGVDPQHNTPDAFSKLLATEVERWAKVIQRAGIKPE
jgi:tripartite-type tricarboxylate transporter receptor subunit TctC